MAIPEIGFGHDSSAVNQPINVLEFTKFEFISKVYHNFDNIF